jgi:hypothetical protein
LSSGFFITTADVSTPENTDKVIMLATNMDDFEDGDFEYKHDKWHYFGLQKPWL